MKKLMLVIRSITFSQISRFLLLIIISLVLSAYTYQTQIKKTEPIVEPQEQEVEFIHSNSYHY
jgi:hypothetical protein